MRKIWDAISRAFHASPASVSHDPEGYTPKANEAAEQSNLRKAMQRVDASMSTKRDFAAGRRSNYVNSFGQTIEPKPDHLTAMQAGMAQTLKRIDRKAAEHRPPFGKRTIVPDVPKMVTTMVSENDLILLSRIREMRLRGGSPCVIDFTRQAELSKVIAYAIDTGDANGAKYAVAFLREWQEGSPAARAEFLASLADEKPL